MNPERQKVIDKVTTKLFDLRELVQKIRDEESRDLMDMPERIRESKEGVAVEDAERALVKAEVLLDEAIRSLNGVANA